MKWDWHYIENELPKLKKVSKNDIYLFFASDDLVLRSIICESRVQYFIGSYIKGPDSKGKMTEGFTCPGKVTHWALLEKVKTD